MAKKKKDEIIEKLKNKLKKNGWVELNNILEKNKIFDKFGYDQTVDFFTYKKKKVFPKAKDVFAALEYTPLNKVKFIIVGLDPYPGYEGKGNGIVPMANGLAFGINGDYNGEIDGRNSLRKIFKKLKIKCGRCDLKMLAGEGVLLLNIYLTLSKNKKDKGGRHKFWLPFTKKAIEMAAGNKKKPSLLIFGVSKDAKKACQTIEKGCETFFSYHPSARGNKFKKQNFKGSSVFNFLEKKYKNL